MVGILLFAVAFALLMLGFPVAFTFAAVAVGFAVATGQVELFAMMPERIYALMTNVTLMSVPLFVFMGMVLQRSGLAEMLLETVGMLFGRLRGGIAIGVVLVGAILAASTGIVGATVVSMSLIALPVMLKHGYDRRFASGIICAAGTLGQIIPPSVVLIVLGEALQVSVGELFRAAFLPGIALAGCIYCGPLSWGWFARSGFHRWRALNGCLGRGWCRRWYRHCCSLCWCWAQSLPVSQRRRNPPPSELWGAWGWRHCTGAFRCGLSGRLHGRRHASAR
jgi:TRAP-type mannitol/chloroaromatic compound transport system permease large subunit